MYHVPVPVYYFGSIRTRVPAVRKILTASFAVQTHLSVNDENGCCTYVPYWLRTAVHSNLIVLTESLKFLFKFFLSFFSYQKKIFTRYLSFF